jgi:hypothetical protein
MRRDRLRLLAYWAALALLPILLLLPGDAARAQSAPQLDAQADPSTVGVGEIVHLQLSASSADGMPGDPQPGTTGGFVVRGHNSAPAQTHISINGSHMDRYTLTTTWVLEAHRTGTFHVGPPSVVVGGVRYTSHPVTITVVPAGQAPRRPPPQQPFPPGMQNPFGMSPFDLWKGFVPGFDNDNQAPAAPSMSTDPKLSLDAPRGPFYFLHSIVDKNSAVVGEQITFSVYEYIDAGAGRVEIDDEDVHDATAADFVKHPLQREDQEPPLLGYASVGGRTWMVKLVRRWALFPLRAGDLTIGPMHVRMLRPASTAGSQRAAETLQIHVTEPPVAGRPPGYALGDVGRFSLTAQVSPREVDQGGAVGVHVEVSGTGNVPATIAAPAREGVEWLAPEVHDALGPSGRDAFGGKRIFDFVVRVLRSGSLDLGEMSLPFWDPEQQKYAIARAPLGRVSVGPSAAASSPQDAIEKPLPGLPAPRGTLEGSRMPRMHPDDSPVFWIAGIGAWPLAFGAGVAGRAAARRILGAWRRRRVSPARELRERLAAATTACDRGDARTADAAIARALEAAITAHAGVSVRGALGTEVSERLERAGVAADAALRLADLLRECDAARFAPEHADILEARARWLRAQGVIRGLEKAG